MAMVELSPIRVGTVVIRNFAHPDWIASFAKAKKRKKKIRKPKPRPY